MPPANEHLEKGKPLRVLVYGKPKTRKTWWALKACEDGFNVIDIDGDDGTHIATQIDPVARERLAFIDVVDELRKARFGEFMARFLKGSKFIWNEDTKQAVLRAGSDVDKHRVHVDVSKLTLNDVVIVDSLTALATSIMNDFSYKNGIDLADAEKPEWEGYRYSGQLMTWMITQLNALPCHVIVIAHEDEWQPKEKDGKTIKFTRTQVKSTSANNASGVSGKFSDVLRFSIMGLGTKIDTASSSDKDGGSRVVAPKKYNFDELRFIDLVKAVGAPMPDPSTPQTAFKFYAPGEEIEVAKPTSAAATSKPAALSGALAGKTSASLTGLIKK